MLPGRRPVTVCKLVLLLTAGAVLVRLGISADLMRYRSFLRDFPLAIRAKMRDTPPIETRGGMNGNEFLKKLKAYGKDRTLPVRFVQSRGKGSHGTVYLGTAFTVLKDRKKEIGKGLLRAMLADLGIDPEAF